MSLLGALGLEVEWALKRLFHHQSYGSLGPYDIPFSNEISLPDSDLNDSCVRVRLVTMLSLSGAPSFWGQMKAKAPLLQMRYSSFLISEKWQNISLKSSCAPHFRPIHSTVIAVLLAELCYVKYLSISGCRIDISLNRASYHTFPHLLV